MRPRQDLISLFSEFINFVTDRFDSWQADLKLRRNMTAHQKMHTNASENFWAIYWHQLWQQNSQSLAKNHLIAYLQEPCYWNAEKISRELSDFQYDFQYKLSDCFQIAIAQVDKVLQGFNSERGYKLKSYASVTLKSLLTNTLRQHKVADFCTNWALLRKITQKQLEKALELAGLIPEEREKYVLVWICFKTLYVPGEKGRTKKLPRPQPETWKAIATLYNKERHHQLSVPGKECSPETLEKRLLKCVTAMRSYLYPKSISLQQPKIGQEGKEGELIDDIFYDDESENLLTKLINQEEEQSQEERRRYVAELLRQALNQIEPELKQILYLYYGEKLIQQEIGDRLGLGQGNYNVSRRLRKARKFLFDVLGEWSKETNGIPLSFKEMDKEISPFLAEWLENYFEVTEES